MKDKEEFIKLLYQLDGKPVAELVGLAGDYDFSRYIVKCPRGETADSCLLFIIRVPQQIAGFPARLFNTPVRKTGLEDYLTREVARALERLARFDREGVARRRMSAVIPGQCILPRTATVVNDEFMEIRLSVHFPAREGRIMAEEARDLFCSDVHDLVDQALMYCNLDADEIERFVDLMEDADRLRQTLPGRGWVGFVAEDARLVRDPASDRPDPRAQARLTVAQDVLTTVELRTNHAVRGLGIPAGVTLLMGDFYSGRRELLQALAAGIYNHIPGDGREMVITVPDAVSVPAEPGRCVQRVDISPFVHRHPACANTHAFTSPAADAVAAQSAATVEMLEAGARVLLFEEAESAPQFLCGDSRVDRLLQSETPSMTPLVHQVRRLVNEMGISLVLSGGTTLAEFVPFANRIFLVEDFAVRDATEEIKKRVAEFGKPVPPPKEPPPFAEIMRYVVPASIDSTRGCASLYIHVPAARTLEFGRTAVTLDGLRQLCDMDQVGTIGRVLLYLKKRYLDQPRPIREILDLMDRDLSTEGLESLNHEIRGDLARPRRYEIAMVLNRLNTIRFVQGLDKNV